MRKVLMVLSVLGLLLPAGASAKGRPEPLPCPDDIAAAILAECPCEGTVAAEGESPSWRNHGQYVRCVVKYANQLRKSDCLDRTARRLIKRCAARSTCGKPGRVLCCVSKVDTCSDDPVPADGTAEGTCGNDPDRDCDVDDDCTKTKARMVRGEDVCLEQGGEPVGEGSVCTACLPMP